MPNEDSLGMDDEPALMLSRIGEETFAQLGERLVKLSHLESSQKSKTRAPANHLAMTACSGGARPERRIKYNLNFCGNAGHRVSSC